MNRNKMAELHRHYVVWQKAMENKTAIEAHTRDRKRADSLFGHVPPVLEYDAFDKVKCPEEAAFAIEEILIKAFDDIIAEEEKAIDEIIERIPRKAARVSMLDYEPTMRGVRSLLIDLPEDAERNIVTGDMKGVKKLLAWKKIPDKLMPIEEVLSAVPAEQEKA